MARSPEALADTLRSTFGDKISCDVSHGQVCIELSANDFPEVARELKDNPEFDFQQLVDLCGIDFLDYGKADWETSERTSSTGFSRGVQKKVHVTSEHPSGVRFAVIYQLLSHALNQRLRVRALLEGEPPVIESVNNIWPSANWYEREAFDLFGILFSGHPDLRRILTDYGFIGHPFRKDFPLVGEVEMRYDPEQGRVIYEPVNIVPRTLVPKVIRQDERYRKNNADNGEEGGEAA